MEKAYKIYTEILLLGYPIPIEDGISLYLIMDVISNFLDTWNVQSLPSDLLVIDFGNKSEM